jgi:hypothetical protein
MKNYLIALAIAGSAGIAAVGLWADEHEGNEHGEYGGLSAWRPSGHGREEGGAQNGYMKDPRYALYKDECGSCHFAYPPALLPSSSWQHLMRTLSDHFGDDAELDPTTAGEIRAFLNRNSAGKVKGDYSERMWRSTRGQAPVRRITETDYFRGQHHEIPAKMVTGNPEVKSFSQCDACHTGAAQGSFEEHRVHIPGYGRFSD